MTAVYKIINGQKGQTVYLLFLMCPKQTDSRSCNFINAFLKDKGRTLKAMRN